MSRKCHHSINGQFSKFWLSGSLGLQVALAKSKGNLNIAIELLRKHVDVFMLDKMAWEELGELYLQVQSCWLLRAGNETTGIFPNIPLWFLCLLRATTLSKALCLSVPSGACQELKAGWLDFHHNIVAGLFMKWIWCSGWLVLADFGRDHEQQRSLMDSAAAFNLLWLMSAG